MPRKKYIIPAGECANWDLGTMRLAERNSNVKFSAIKIDYLNQIRYERKLAKSTFVTYQSWLNRYERWLGSNGYPDSDLAEAFSAGVLRTYFYSLAQSEGKGGCQLRPRTLRSAFHPLRGMGEYLIQHKIKIGGKVVTDNPAKVILLPQKDAAVRLLVSDTEVWALLDAAERQASACDVAQSTAILATLLYTGVRANELIHIKVEDVSVEQGQLLVANGKGGKSRTLFPAPEYFAAVKPWLCERAKINCEHSCLWAQGPRRAMSYERLLAHLEELKAIAGFKGARNIKPQSLRHWFATNLYRQVKNIMVVQQALGHAHAQTTYTYLHLHEEECRAMSTMTLGKPVETILSDLEESAEGTKGHAGMAPEPDRDTRQKIQRFTRVRHAGRSTKPSRWQD